MNALQKAKHALEIACLEQLLGDPKPITVSLYSYGASLDLQLTAEDIKAAATRQLEQLREQTKCDGFKASVCGTVRRCTLESGHEGQCTDKDGVRWWRAFTP